jgi:sodium/potassium/calcium exchanger 6
VSEERVFLIDYRALYRGPFSEHHGIFYLLVTILIFLLFYMMYVIADRHLTWALEHLSRFCRLSPDMAGLTFLAFGNGAPDFFTAVFGAGEAPELILGSSVGSGLFVMCIVLGLVILLAKHPEDQSFVRVLEEGAMRKAAVTILPDGSLPRLSKASKRILSEPKVTSTAFVRNIILYGVCVAFLSLFAIKRKVPFWQPLMLVLLYVGYLSTAIGLHYYQQHEARKAAKRLRPSPSPRRSGSGSIDPVDQTSVLLKESEAFAELEELPIHHRVPAAVLRTSWTFAERTGVLWLDLAVLAVKMPIDLMYNLTVLPMEDAALATSCAPHLAALRLTHRVRAILCPWGFAFLAGSLLTPGRHLYGLAWCIAYLCTSAALSALLALTTSNRQPPLLFPLHVALAFATCILWIYAVSRELVACLSATGSLAGISSTLLGIVVLAWGNSFGDLVANVTVARNGHIETAISACFCGPIQNILLTIGVSFMVAAFKSPKRVLRVAELNPRDIYLALTALLAVLSVVAVGVILLGRFRVPRWLGWTLIATYLVYLPVAIVGGFDSLRLMALHHLPLLNAISFH